MWKQIFHCSNSVKAMCGVYTNKGSKTKNKFVAVEHSHWVKWGSEITTLWDHSLWFHNLKILYITALQCQPRCLQFHSEKGVLNFFVNWPLSIKAFVKFSFINPWSANSIKWSNTLKQFLSCCRQIVWVCLTILWSWRLKS